MKVRQFFSHRGFVSGHGSYVFAEISLRWLGTRDENLGFSAHG